MDPVTGESYRGVKTKKTASRKNRAKIAACGSAGNPSKVGPLREILQSGPRMNGASLSASGVERR